MIGVNNFGTTVLTYSDVNGVTHGSVRNPLGHFTTVDYPAATASFPVSISDFGVLYGSFIDTNNVRHGFIATPR